MRIGELFAGYGGLGMGVQAALGGDIAWFSEFDKGPSKILAHRFPGIPNHGDITKIDWSAVEPIDILTGGSPCQDLSHAGKRQGMTEGTRSNLWVAMREAIAQLRPGLIVWENVRGAYSAAADSEVEPCAGCVGDGTGVSLRALGRVLGDLSDLGYDARWHGLRAADVGAPHGRFRVFVAAFDADGGQRGTSGARQDQATPAVMPLRGSDSTPAHATDIGHERTRRAWDGRAGSANSDTAAWGQYAAAIARWERALGRPNEGHKLDRHGPLLPTPRAMDGAKGGPNQRGSAGDLMLPSAVQDWGQYAAAMQRWEHLTREAPASTETGPKGNPRLSAAFSEWMMGLPAGWVTDVPGITRNEALKAIGNGVVPQQCAAALRLMLGAGVVA